MDENFWDVPEVELDGYKAGENFEADVAQLVAAVSSYMTTQVNKEEVMDALDCVATWLEQEDDPRQMGWVGRNGLP